jgi:hypothetical protein
MDILATVDAFLFDSFRLDQRGLSTGDDGASFVPVPTGSRALEVLPYTSPTERPDEAIVRV